jgi:EmrB/QacA subfamily drug resistance transporter
VLLVVGMGTFLSALAGSTVPLALPEIGRELGISLEASSWVLQGYLMVITVTLLVAGRLGDLLGLRRMYLAGFTLFGVASALCGAAGSFALLLAARTLQGLGGASLTATGPALVTTSFAADRRGRGLGMLATATYAGLTLGPMLGGLLVGSLGWSWIFFVNVPVAVVVVGLGIVFLPRTRPSPEARFDSAGAATFLLGAPLVLVALAEGRSWGWTSPATLGAALAGALLLAAFVAVERRRDHPLLDLRLFVSPVFRGSTLAALANYVALFVPVLLLPFYLTEGLGASSAQAGLVLAAQPLVMALVVTPAGVLSDRLGTRGPATLGKLVMVAALGGMATLGEGSGFAAAALWLGFLGLGTGIFISPNSSALMGSAPRRQQGSAGGVLAVARTLGMVLGVALANTLYHAAGGQTGEPWAAADYRALRIALAAAAGVALLGAAAAWSAGEEAGVSPPPQRL